MEMNKQAAQSNASDDDYLVIILRTCIALGKFPIVDWSVSIMAVDDCAQMLTERILATDPALFNAEAREVKGDLVPWSHLRDWLLPSTTTPMVTERPR